MAPAAVCSSIVYCDSLLPKDILARAAEIGLEKWNGIAVPVTGVSGTVASAAVGAVAGRGRDMRFSSQCLTLHPSAAEISEGIV